MIVPHSFEIALVNGKRDSRQPNGQPPFAQTQIAQIAATMVPGQFYSLNGGANDPSFPSGVTTFSSAMMGGTGWSSSDLWAPVSVWNPSTLQTYSILDRTAAGSEQHLVNNTGYNAAAHSWVRRDFADRSDLVFGQPHVYGHWAVDTDRNKIYRPAETTLYTYDMVTDGWTTRTIPNIGISRQSGIAYFPPRQTVVGISTVGEVREWSPDTDVISVIGTYAPHSGRHGHVHYNPIRQEICCAFGDSTLHMTLVTAGGTVTGYDLPAEVTSTANRSTMFCFYDPVTGNYLVYNQTTRMLWEWEPDLDQWLLALNLSSGPNIMPTFHGFLIAPIPEANVILWLHRDTPRLYKHATAFGGG